MSCTQKYPRKKNYDFENIDRFWIFFFKFLDLKFYLVDMFVTGPSKTAGIVATNNMEGRVIGWTPRGVDHGHQGLLLGLEIVGRLLGHLLSCIKQDQGSWI